MTTLRYVVFGQPIPVADTHRREPRFEASDGWTIELDERTETWRITGHGVEFWTDGVNSWTPVPLKEEPHPFAIEPALEPKTGARKKR